MTKLKNLFTKNILIKIICLSAATFLWLYVALAQNNTAKLPGTIPIKAFNSRQSLIAVYDIKSVEIKITADSSNWKNLSADSFSAYVDLSGYSAGTFEVPVNVVSSVSGVQVIEKTPDKILVSLEPVTSKEVSISKKIEGSAADGMTVGSVIFSPTKVSIQGAKSAIENISEVIAPIQLNGESDDFERNVSLALPENKAGQSIVNISPPETLAQISIIKGSGVKTVGVKVNVTGNPQSSYYISDIKVTPSVVDIAGLSGIVSETKYLETASVDVSNITAALTKEVQLSLPDGVYLSGKASTSVQVEIKLAEANGIQEISTSNFNLLNANGSSIITSTPAEIKIRFTTTASLAGVIRPDDFRISLDLSKKNPTPNGSCTFDVTKDMISAPAGVLILEIIPSSLLIRTKT